MRRVVVLVVLLVNAGVSAGRVLWVWPNNLTLWTDAAAHSQKPRVLLNYGTALLNAQRLHEAVDPLNRAYFAADAPHVPMSMRVIVKGLAAQDLAITYGAVGQNVRAAQWMDLSLRYLPFDRVVIPVSERPGP